MTEQQIASGMAGAFFFSALGLAFAWFQLRRREGKLRSAEVIQSAREAVLQEWEKWQWIPADQGLPPTGLKVIANYLNQNGSSVTVMAIYAGDREFEIPYPDYDDPVGKYFDMDEDEERCWLYEGWYEYVDNLDDNALIPITEGKVSAWMEAPLSPAGIQKALQDGEG